MITLKAYAKLNLFLDITGKLPNGYHELVSVMQSISLYDKIEIMNGKGIYIDCPGIPKEQNIAYKAAVMFFEEAKLIGDATIKIEKNIPMMAGMGGGSADAAAVLLGLNKMYDDRLSGDKLLEIAKKLGADVPFSLIGGSMKAEGIGEKLSPLSSSLDSHLVIAKGNEGCSTPKVYSLFDEAPITAPEDAFSNTVKALNDNNEDLLLTSIFNGLTPAAMSLCPSIERTLDILNAQEGCKNAFMTGSGSACYAFFADKKTAQTAVSNINSSNTIKAYYCRPTSCGAEFI